MSSLEAADKLKDEKKYKQALDEYYKLVKQADSSSSDDLKLKETAISRMADVYVVQKSASDLKNLLAKIRPNLSNVPKAKTAKIVRILIDKMADIEDSEAEQLSLIEESISWAKSEKRSYLRQRLEARLASLQYDAGKFNDALSLCAPLSTELKKLDDKLMLVEVKLVESRCYLALRNIARAKASLTAARTNANAVYTPPAIQASMDILAGMLCSEEKDYKTGFSYFYEAFENFHQLENGEAHAALNYMLLTKIMMKKPEEVPTVLTSKLALKYAGPQVESLRAIAAACRARSLHDFEAAKEKFPTALKSNQIVQTQLTMLYGELLEQHLLRLVEPYSCIELSRVAELMQLHVSTVEKHLAHMILEQKLNGILDQGEGNLTIFDEQENKSLYPKSLETIGKMDDVVSELFQQANMLR